MSDPTEDFRTAAHRLVDWIASSFLSHQRDIPLAPRVLPGAVRRALAAEAPERGESYDAILASFERDLLPAIAPGSHPRYLAYFSSSASEPSILGELLAAAINPNAMLWRASPAGVELEQVVSGWVRSLLGLPASYMAVATDGGSMSNLQALAAARERTVPGVRRHGLREAPPLGIYCSEEAHSSVDKAAIVLGLGLDAIRRVPVDDRLTMTPEALDAAMGEDARAGIRPLAVIATAGTTSTGAIDPLADIAEVSARHGAWLHIDASYGGSVAALPEHRSLLAGWERADSITVNPHKWMFVPLDYSLLFVREPAVLHRAFSHVPEYLRVPDTQLTDSPMDFGIALGRRVRALRLWYTLRALGAEGLRARIRRHLELAAWLAAEVDHSPDFEIVAPRVLSVVTLRHRPRGLAAERLDEHNERLLRAILEEGDFLLSHTRVRGRYAIRVAINNYYTEERDVREVWDALRRCAAAL